MSNVNLAAEFPQREGLVYLNHAAVAPWPNRTAAALERFARENVVQGAFSYREWNDVETRLRERMQALINAPSASDIALLKSTSEALSVVAYGLDWRNGDNLVINDQEFPSNRIVWESLQRLGVSVRVVSFSAIQSPESALIEACDASTRLIAVSSVQYGTGLRMDLDELGRECRSRGILLCVDGIQSLGALPIDLAATPVDFLMADGHKWLLGPEGLALFYCRAELRPQLKLWQYGWHMVKDRSNFDKPSWEVTQTAMRFECGSPNMLGIHALDASLSLLLEVGMEEIGRRVLANTALLMSLIDESATLELVSLRDEARRSGIVSFRHRRADQDALFRHLNAHGIVCALRGGGVRFSPHFYTPEEDLRSAVAAAAEFSD
jgi:cysteine desulfurase / selenocysteine lyase